MEDLDLEEDKGPVQTYAISLNKDEDSIVAHLSDDDKVLLADCRDLLIRVFYTLFGILTFVVLLSGFLIARL